MAVHVDRSLSLPQSEYFPDPQAKSGIALHHTVCHSAHDALASFEGVIGHAMVRDDKSDPAPDPRLWATLEQMAGLQSVAVTTPLTGVERDALFSRNARRLNRMDTAAGSLVKNLLMELKRRRTYLVAANAAAYATGYGAAYASYQDLTWRYIAELNKPRIRLPSIVGFVGAVGVGLVVGRVTR